MRRRQVLAMAVALGASLGAAACGVPDSTDVVVDGRGQETDPQGSSGDDGLPPGPDTGGNIEEFVNRFLQAPAGDWDGAPERVKKFLSAKEQATWQPPRDGITVIRLLNGQPEIRPLPSTEVVLKVKQIGVLTSRGTLEPPTSQITEYTFTVGAAGQGPGLAVLTPPSAMLLTDTALDKWYERRPIYFWDTAQDNLVPDLRYLPTAEGEDARPKTLIQWLIDGPSEWLKSGVLDLPDGTEQLRGAYKEKSNGQVIVDLNGAAEKDQDLGKLMAQICWSLRQDFSDKVVLQIEHTKRREGTISEFLGNNPTYRVTQEQAQGPQGFAVAGNEVRRVTRSNWGQAPADLAVLGSPDNKNVRSAAVAGGHAALVRDDGDRVRLWVGPDEKGRFTRTSLVAASMSRPVLVDDQDVGYVAANGKLYQFTLDKAAITEVIISQLPQQVTAIALAPDGRRLAVVASGSAYLVALGGNGDGSGAVARPIPTMLDKLSGISWLSETGLAITGTYGSTLALARLLTLDGAVLDASPQVLPVQTVYRLASFPQDPVDDLGGIIVVDAKADNIDRAYEVFSAQISYLKAEELVPPVKDAEPTAVFFLD